ncbi:MAG: hypothetical protein NT002_08470 [candidate division Zixibacteria bacterium]|nr:hypothetical protein [candidate division Zixibacteria bacterium]
MIALFVAHALSLSFTQDDAFISYRYVKNFLAGEGLVFNPGEQVEGYTNFFFIILMILCGRFGLDYILMSKIIGIASGALIMLLSFLWFMRDSEEESANILALGAPLLLLTNGAFAYWSISGLETVFFAALVFWGLYLAAERNILFVPVMAVATLTRPEGGLVFVLIIIYSIFIKAARRPEIVRTILFYGLLVLPQIIFRLYYYHDLLPNPFYAKTGLSAEYFVAGVGYAWLFLQQYGLYGLLLLLPIAGFKLLNPAARLLVWVSFLYAVYILMVGGDVLHGHRFFIVLLAPFYLLFTTSLYAFADRILKLRKKPAMIANYAILIIIGVMTFLIPRERLLVIRSAERGLVDNMQKEANIIHAARPGRFTVACTTIGAFSYYCDAIIIDMLGLTDRTIAHNPRPLPGIQSGWKERNYNIAYLLERNPDLILFSTGTKPSAPAEKALFLSSKFRNGYYPVFFQAGRFSAIYRAKGTFTGPDEYFINSEFIDDYIQAITYHHNKQYAPAFEYCRICLQKAPADFYIPLEIMGDIRMREKNFDEGVPLMEQAAELSGGYALPACFRLAAYYRAIGDTARANFYAEKFKKYNRFD